MSGLNQSIQTNDPYDDYGAEHGVRRPSEQYQDQMVAGPDERIGLLGVTPAQMYAMQQR